MLWVIVFITAAAAVWAVVVYNGLVRAQNRYRNAFSQIGVQLKRRYDLIPNLVESAKGYLKHEQSTLENVTRARNQALACLNRADGAAAAPLAELAAAESSLNTAMRGLNIQIEAYPELHAAENIRQLNEEIGSTENRIAFARQAYNDAVMAYNTLRGIFPANLLAPAFGHGIDAPLLDWDGQSEIEQTPSVRFD